MQQNSSSHLALIQGGVSNILSGRWLGATYLSKVTTLIFVCLVAGFIGGGWLYGLDCILWSLAALMAGATAGFLFGIPRILQEPLNGPARESADVTSAYHQRVNTNLEEISDWLTKIIIGVGLIELKELPHQFQSLVAYTAGGQYRQGTVGAVLVYFGFLGFMSGYLLTRIFLSKAFAIADREVQELSENVQVLKQKVSDSAEATEPDDVSFRMSMESPRGAIVEAWLKVMQAARELLKDKDFPPQAPDLQVVQELARRNIIDESQAAAIHQLRKIRNQAAHVAEAQISPADARAVVESSNEIVRQLGKKASNP